MEQKCSTLFVYKAKIDNQSTPAVIICPGGSYHHLGMLHEGRNTAEWFQQQGITAFVLQYRVAMDGAHYPTELEDIQRAIQIVRENHGEYRIDENKVAVLGYSAGGHLALMAGVFSETHNQLKKLGIETNVSLKPNLVMAIYPVVSMQDSIGHKRSRKSLLGTAPSKKLEDELSMEMQVTSAIPPVFLLACKDDPIVDYHNSIELDKSLTKAGVPHEFDFYEWGGHGFGMRNTKFMKAFHWNNKLLYWLKKYDFIS